ncbi:MAG: glycosyltransferase family 1 protein [Chitinophagaceae bacterium]|nr:MAG: glycosyltransferase family 1 protein [Chitinophagaceae bacterium]
MPENKKIKVLQSIRQGKIGGGESHLLNLVENIDRGQFDPVVLSFTDGPMISTLSGMDIPAHIIHTEKPFDFTKWKKVKKLLVQEKVELIHAHGTRANSNVLWAARSLGIPVIYTIHGWSFHQDQGPMLHKLRVLGEKYLTSRTDVNISVSLSNQNAGKKLIPGFKSRIINYGIDQKKFNSKGTYPDVRRELGIPENKTLVLFIARFTSHKQPLAMIEAFAKAVRVNPSLHLLLVGDGDQKEEGLRLIEKFGIAGNVTVQSFRQDVPAVLAAADIFVLPSLWEGLPIGLLEAMTMAKPIIASNVDGTCDVIEPGVNGMLVETGNLVDNLVQALVALGNDRGLQEKFSVNALETVREKFTVTLMTRRIEDLYLEVLNKKRLN